MYVLKEISPTTFNVLSDLAGEVVAGTLLFVLGVAYPYLVWAAVKRGGHGVALDGLLAPPTSLLEAIQRFREGPWLGFWVLLVLIIATASHTLADVFLDFVTVEVGVNDTYFLGTEPGTVPTYGLFEEEPVIATINFPSLPVALLVSVADDVAQGLSRFSILPPGLVGLTKYESLVNGAVKVLHSELTLLTLYEQNSTARSLSFNCGVECQSPNSQLVDEALIVRRVSIANDTDWTESIIVGEEIPFPVCDYDKYVSPKTSKQGPDLKILRWSQYRIGAVDASLVSAFGFRNVPTQSVQQWIQFSANETKLAIDREDWRFGRRVRDGLTFVMGIQPSLDNSIDALAGGVEFQVEYSVLSGPLLFQDHYLYTISSWSHSCPIVDEMGDLSIVDGLEQAEEDKASGCLVDTQLLCTGIYPPDLDASPTEDITGTPQCLVVSLGVTLLAGISHVDPFMLAAYAGIATRNGAINVVDTGTPHPVALNSIAAAYLMTREIIEGTVAVEGVRASIEVGFIVFLLLPLAAILPLIMLLFRKEEGHPPPVPRSLWDVLVLGRDEPEHVPPREAHVSFPTKSTSLRFGISQLEESQGHSSQRLGLGESFVPLHGSLFASNEVEHFNMPKEAPAPLVKTSSRLLEDVEDKPQLEVRVQV